LKFEDPTGSKSISEVTDELEGKFIHQRVGPIDFMYFGGD
jgi:hypothetical protein